MAFCHTGWQYHNRTILISDHYKSDKYGCESTGDDDIVRVALLIMWMLDVDHVEYWKLTIPKLGC